MKIQIRTATVDDADEACSVIRRSIVECCGDAKRLQAWLRNQTPEVLRGLILTPGAFSVVARVDGAIAGFGSSSGTGKVLLCHIVPSVRFTGVGKALLAATADQATQAGLRTLHLTSRQGRSVRSAAEIRPLSAKAALPQLPVFSSVC